MHVTFCSIQNKVKCLKINFDVNIVNIALIAFGSLAVTKLAHWPMSTLL